MYTDRSVQSDSVGRGGLLRARGTGLGGGGGAAGDAICEADEASRKGGKGGDRPPSLVA